MLVLLLAAWMAGALQWPRRPPLVKLARVEVQSIMHFLARGDLLRLARCSRRMYGDADDKAAWKQIATSPLHVNRHTLAGGLVEGIRAGGLFFRRRPPIPIYSLVTSVEEAPAVFKAMQSLGAFARLTLVIEVNQSLEAQQWCELFEQLPLVDLTTCFLMVSCYCPAGPAFSECMVRWMPQMTHLHTLRLHVGWTASTYEGIARIICSMDHLAELDVSLPFLVGTGPGPEPGPAAVLTALVDCAHLTRLRVDHLPLDTDLLQQFIAHSQSAARLRWLALSSSFLSAPPSGDFSACFAAMSQLETLTLSDCHPSVALLRHARHAASLRRIHLEDVDLTPDTIEAVRRIHSALPSAVHLHISYNLEHPAMVIQEVRAIDSVRITCRLR